MLVVKVLSTAGTPQRTHRETNKKTDERGKPSEPPKELQRGAVPKNLPRLRRHPLKYAASNCNSEQDQDRSMAGEARQANDP